MKKFSKNEIIALSVIAVLIIGVIGIWIGTMVYNVNQANNKLKNTENTIDPTATWVTEIPTETVEKAEEGTEFVEDSSVDAVPADPVAGPEDSETEGTTSPVTQSNTQSSTGNKNNNKKPTNKPTENNNSNSGDKIEQIVPETTPVEKDEDILSINGVKCNVGNTVEVTLDLKTPKVLENFQGYTQYDNKYLEFVSVSDNIQGRGLFNNKGNVIYYNGSDINKGYNFTEGGTLFTITFKVLKKGNTQIENTMEVMSDQTSTPVKPADCKITLGVFNKN